jgi:phytoene dehydrogenase-like protein
MAHAHYFEFVVVGDGIGGLFAALLLARAGARVAVLGQVENFPADEPFVSPVVRVRPIVQNVPSLFHYLLESATAHEGTANLFIPRQPGFQLLSEDLRIDITANEESKTELERELPEFAGQFQEMQEVLDRFGFDMDGFLADRPLPAGGWFERRRVRKDFEKIEKSIPKILGDSPMTDMLRGVALASGNVSLTDQLSLVDLRSLARWRDADSTLAGGRAGLVKHLAMLCTKQGVKVDLNARVQELVLRRWKASEVIHSAGQSYGCGSVIFSRGVDQLLTLLPKDTKQLRYMEQFASRVKPQNLIVELRCKLPSHLIPVPMKDRSIFLPSKPIVEGAGPIVLTIEGPKPTSKESKSTERLFCAVVAVPGEDEPSYIEHIEEQLTEAIEEVLPYWTENAIPVDNNSPIRVSRAYTYEKTKSSIVGVEGLEPRTPLKNVWLASRQVLPGLGLEGEMLTGRRVASKLHKGAIQKKGAGSIARTLQRV